MLGGTRTLVGCLQRLSGALILDCKAAARSTDSAAQRHFSSTDATISGRTIYAACVLERLPVLKQPPEEWEAEYHAWAEHRKLQGHAYKQYPTLEKKQKTAKQKEDEDASFTPVPSETKADTSGDRRTMKRRLSEKLLLLVKQRAPPGTPASSDSAAAASAQPAWAFPAAQHQQGETIRLTAERALRKCLGKVPVYFIGNAPMAHYALGAQEQAGSVASTSSDSSSSNSSDSSSSDSSSRESSSGASHPEASSSSGQGAVSSSSTTTTTMSSSSNGTLFFMLAQVVNDPWEVELQGDAATGAADYAWVTKAELKDYLRDARLLELAHKML